jgi:signal transduction histidine kinase
MSNQLEEKTFSSLYKEANLIAADYLPEYFSEEASFFAIRTQLRAMQLYLESSLWFTDSEGKILVSASLDDTNAPTEITDFNPAEAGSAQYLIGNYHNYFQEDMITVIAPVTQGFSTKGYFLIHYPMSSLEEQRNLLMWPVYVTLVVIYAFSFLFLIGIHFFIYRPLRNVTMGATQYASGNLNYEIPIYTHDEMGYLSVSLNYMATQLRDMEEYQKKFIANVSHDFRSPLTSIKGYVEAIADGTIPPEMQEKYLNIILFEAERLTDLTQDLLTLNEFDTKELLLDKTQFDIQEMIKNTANSFEGTCTKNRISIELLFLPKEALVFADARKIQQVLYNLLDNAIKFSENDSTITVEVSERNEKIFISIKDSGCGIAKKDLGKIWERFYKTDQSRGKDKKGTGLGLSIVKEAILAHDEHINVVSTEGVGTEFIFSLSKR